MIQLQERTVTEGATGITETWRPVGYFYAKVIPLDVRTVADYQKLNTVVSHKILIKGEVNVKIGKHRFVGDKIYVVSTSAKYYRGYTEVMVREWV